MNSKFLHAKYLAVLLLGIVILLLVSFDAFSKTEIDLGGNAPLEMNASQVITREVTRSEDYETTCTDQVADGTTTVCSGGVSETRCRKVPGVGEECWQETTGESCSEETTYRTVTYSCTQTRYYTEHVYDYTVDAKIFVTKGESAKDFDLNKCRFGVSLGASDESYSAFCQEAIVRAKVVSRKEEVNPTSRNKSRDIKIDLDFASIEGLNALKGGLSSLSFNNGVASFISADLKSASNFKLSAKLTRNRFLLKDKVLLDRELRAGDFKVEARADGLFKVSFDLAKMTGLDATKKHTLKVDLKSLKAVDVKGSINEPKLENAFSASIIINQ